MAAGFLNRYRHGATKMVAKGKTYGKKKARDIISLFADLSVSPTKPNANAITRILAPIPNSQNDALLETAAVVEVEQLVEPGGYKGEEADEGVDLDEDKENGQRRKIRLGKQPEKRTEISELTSLNFVDEKVADFKKFCKGWEKEFRLTKIGQGSFATVLKMESKSRPGQYSVWKLMPLKPCQGSGSRPYHNQTLIKDAATEVKMLVAMSDIDGFVQFRSAHVVKGLVPKPIGKAHESWAKNLLPEDTWFETMLEVEFPSKDQLWLLMEMTDAGQDLDSILCTARSEKQSFSIHEISDIFWGIAEALMRGETQADFEHRDLHPGNICVKLRDEPLHLNTEHGVPRLSKREVTLIDYTQSRLTLESGDVLATAVDKSIFRQTDADPIAQRQYDVYRTMRELVKKRKKPRVPISQMWKDYVPMTNVLWLHYLLKELMMLTEKKSGTQAEEDMIKALNSLANKLQPGMSEHWEYHSAREVVCGFLVDPTEA